MNCPICSNGSNEAGHLCSRCIAKKSNRRFWLVAGIVGLPPLLLVIWLLSSVVIREVVDARRAACQKNLKDLTMAALDYRRAHDGRLPDLSSPQTIRAALGATPFYSCSGEPYHGNTLLSRKKVSEIQKPDTVVLFYEIQDAHSDGRNISYVDGHVKWTRAQRWKEMERVLR